MSHPISLVIARAAKLKGQRVAADRLDHLEDQLQELVSSDPIEQFTFAWKLAELDGEPARLSDPVPADMPFLAFKDDAWFFVNSTLGENRWRAVSADDARVNELELSADVVCLTLPSRNLEGSSKKSSFHLIKDAVFEYRGIIFSAVLATALVSILALATSLYAMQIYDRVIPNSGFDTLIVLTVGVGISILLELMLKLLRSRLVDTASNQMDKSLSQWFFSRMLGIRMESRPQSVGTIASQIKGFEMVRGLISSTSVFVMADVPFSLFFIFVIYLIGGPVVIVPLIFMPLALFAGLMFQKMVQRYTQMNLAAINMKTGLLVEAVDGAESLKANGSEWTVESRWKKLVYEAAEPDLKIRHYTTTSQSMTATFQQISYTLMVAVGAYQVAQNELTMGGLLACSIIGNRAMQPIIQLPGTMMQWALAKAALQGLDQIVDLPNEADDAHKTLMPQVVDSGFNFERVRFAYDATSQVVLDIERLQIKPGESIGLIGAIGSGKSTLLKLASGLYRPLEGRVTLGGVDMASLGLVPVRETVGYLPQEIKLFSGTLRDNILAGLPDPGEEAILEAAKRTGLINLIHGQPSGLALTITEGGRGVSGGQKQQIALTRMLLAKPKVWLLDEPTGAMDAMTEAAMVKLFKELVEEGITLIVTTHKTALLPLLNRLIVIQGGRIQIDGPRDAVMAKISGKQEPKKAVSDAS